jgi:hypothetical protein
MGERRESLSICLVRALAREVQREIQIVAVHGVLLGRGIDRLPDAETGAIVDSRIHLAAVGAPAEGGDVQSEESHEDRGDRCEDFHRDLPFEITGFECLTGYS